VTYGSITARRYRHSDCFTTREELRTEAMMGDREDTNPSANVPQGAEEPAGDRGGNDKTWSPAQGEQGISNRPDDDTDDRAAMRD